MPLNQRVTHSVTDDIAPTSEEQRLPFDERWDTMGRVAYKREAMASRVRLNPMENTPGAASKLMTR